MSPNTVKTSVRLTLESLDILKAYSATHGCTQTTAINAIILASTATHTHALATQVPPVIATQDSQWQRSVEARLAKLEATTHLPPTIATHSDDDTPSFKEGQVIDGQSNKTYKMLWASFDASQKIDRNTHYYLSNKLGVICRVCGYSRAGKQQLEVRSSFPRERVIIRDDGTFLTKRSDGSIYWDYEGSEPTPDEVFDASQKIDNTEYLLNNKLGVIYSRADKQQLEVWCKCFGKVIIRDDGTFLKKAKGNGDLYWTLEPFPDESTDYVEVVNDEIATVEVTSIPQSIVEQLTELELSATHLPPIRLTKDELLGRFSAKLNSPGQLNTLRSNLDAVGLPKLEKGWTVKYDPDGKAWIPESDSRDYWVEVATVG